MTPHDDDDSIVFTKVEDGQNSGLKQRRVTIERGDKHLDRVVAGIHDLSKHVHPPVPNPAPLGLLAFGFTTCLLQMKTTELTGSSKDQKAGVELMLLGFAMFFGGLLQIIAGISEIRRNNIFGYTAFCAYGGFWMSLSTVHIILFLSPNPPTGNALVSEAVLFLLGIMSVMLWVLTFKLNKTICLLFFLLVMTCFLLAFGVQNPTVDIVGGWFGILTSANAWWLAFVELVNDVFGEGKEIIPVGHWHWNKNKHAGAMHSSGRILGHRISQIDLSRYVSRRNLGHDPESATDETGVEVLQL